MKTMRKALVAILITVAACGQAGDPSDTSAEAAPPSTPKTATTSTFATQPYEVQNCDSPPVTFSALCEMYELTQSWHVDRPARPQDLADIALRALRSYSDAEGEPRPRSLICAVPDEAFTGFCEELSRMVGESEIAIGPAVDAVVSAIAQRAFDPFTYYVPPDQVGSFRLNGVVEGVGVLLDARDAVGSRCAVITAACPVQIVFVLDDNPGADAGLRAGDIITAVDGAPVDGAGFADTAAALAGDEMGTVELDISRGEETLVFTITRSELTIPTVLVRLPQTGVGYIRIPDFQDDVPELVGDAIDALSEASPHTMIIDLRDNPGGLLDSAIEVASEFIDGGTVMQTFAPDEHVEHPADAGGSATRERLIVVVNKGSASAAEVLAGALRDRRGALIVGSDTFGKDAVQIRFDLRNGGELHVTVARWSTPDGATVAQGGLSPDRELVLTADMTIEELTEAALEAAS